MGRSPDVAQNAMAAQNLTRAELYELVWSEPARTLAPKLGLSDVGLTKLCRRYKIPKPGVGHWEKVRHGKRVRRPPLPAKPHGSDEKVVIAEHHAPHVIESERVTAQRAYEGRDENRIRVRSSLRGAHPLVSNTRSALDARIKGGTTGWGDPRVWPGRSDCLDVHVSRGAIGRALRIFDALIRASEARGFSVSVQQVGGAHATCVTVLGERIRVALEERCRQEEHPTKHEWQPVEKILVPTGRLVLRINEYLEGVRKSWSDGKRQRLEDCLNSMMVSFVRVAEGLQRRRAEIEERRRQREEAAERRRAEERRRAKEEARRARLRSQATAWSEARIIREFIVATEASGRGPDGQEGEALAEWLAWARALVDELDPLCSGSPDKGDGI